MTVENLGVEAKEAAVREVSKLFPLPELLSSISSIKSDYISRQQANDAQPSTMVAEQAEHAQAGLESLSLSQKTIHQLRQNFISIEKLCQECQNLIENHDQIKILSNARNNQIRCEDKVENRVKILSDLRELTSAESLDSFTLVYTNILEHHPDCPPEVVEKLVGLREGIPRKDAKEVIQECKEIYENAFVDGNPPKAGFVFPRVKPLSVSKGSVWRKLT